MMKHKSTKHLVNGATVIVCAGFEDRVLGALSQFEKLSVVLDRVILIRFGGNENRTNIDEIRKLSSRISNFGAPIEFSREEVEASDFSFLNHVGHEGKLLFDVTGSSRSLMIRLLSTLHDSDLSFDILYTEAAEYYPEKEQFEKQIGEVDVDTAEGLTTAYHRLSRYEQSRILHSSHCEIEEFDDLRGLIRPNYPLFLITFLTFKRGRLSAILSALEANAKLLIRGVPVRKDLKWRVDAIKVPNADLISDRELIDLETLNWEVTYDYLVSQYELDSNRFRYNFIVAPLGSKMQTVACWKFAKERPEVSLITSTPVEHYFDRYSNGSGETFYFPGF
ncbi:MAG: hypothetical protein ABJK59_02000 [Erythrobacter sp.]|uniref:hypothetical protein n=1 Tax=Erythrobacter sp. TaxID=1042 RepID=UPI00329A6731